MKVGSTRDLGMAIRNARRGHGLSQTDLAARMRVSRRSVAEMEAGNPAAELSVVLAILESLGLQVAVEAPQAISSDACSCSVQAE